MGSHGDLGSCGRDSGSAVYEVAGFWSLPYGYIFILRYDGTSPKLENIATSDYLANYLSDMMLVFVS